ncbi:hypothetical protein STAS_17870 [Striga asiatica]|uniref:Uncharacterized protein n=1 Tax=Striga asiatica TaxID=4170 RepID=A0A5A7Q7C5_STRAF|nr:hypothetical protein STAS_17870 [Striga asiatica]
MQPVAVPPHPIAGVETKEFLTETRRPSPAIVEYRLPSPTTAHRHNLTKPVFADSISTVLHFRHQLADRSRSPVAPPTHSDHRASPDRQCDSATKCCTYPARPPRLSSATTASPRPRSPRSPESFRDSAVGGDVGKVMVEVGRGCEAEPVEIGRPTCFCGSSRRAGVGWRTGGSMVADGRTSGGRRASGGGRRIGD